MNKTAKLGFVIAAAMAAASGAAFAQSTEIKLVDPKDSPYVVSPSGTVVVDPYGLCWRTGFWSLDAAKRVKVEGSPYPVGCACEASLKNDPVCLPPPPPPPAPAAAPPTPTPPVSAAPQTEKITFAAETLFAFDKADLKPEGKKVLDDLVSKLAGVNLEVIIAVGYTDRIGSDAYNLTLSQKRAASVKSYLTGKGIEPNRVYTEGKGKANPVKECGKADGKTQKGLIDCLQPNRRVEVEVVGTRPVRR